MKKCYCFPIYICICACIGVSADVSAQFNVVPDSVELQVLKNIYDSLGGPGWTNKSNWPTSGNWPASATSAQFDTWRGITVSNGDIRTIDLGYNNLTGQIPSSLSKLTRLAYVYLSNNHISGTIPPSIGSMNSVLQFFVADNDLTGAIPPELGNMTNLQRLQLNGNELSGSIPPSLCNLPNLTDLRLGGNNLTGSIPTDIGNLDGLTVLYLEFNQLSGGIPASIANLVNLRYLNFSSNQLSGSIPENMGNLDKLINLYLNSNELTGTLPASIGNMVDLEIFNLSVNQFTGSIPVSFGGLTSLWSFNIRQNELTGVFPALGNWPQIAQVQIYDNHFSGDFPAQLENCTALTSVNAHKNNFTSLPATLLGLTALASLNFENNDIDSIPDFSTHVNKANLSLHLRDNRLAFGQIETFVNKGLELTTYSQQKLFDDIVFLKTSIDQDMVIVPRDAGVNGTYTWYFQPDGTTGYVTVNSQNQDVTQKTFKRSPVQAGHAGLYRYRMTNSTLSGYIESIPITVRMGSDLVWNQMQGVATTDEGVVTKTAVDGWSNAKAISENALVVNTDGWFEFVIDRNISTNNYTAGFSQNSDNSRASLAYGVRISNVGGQRLYIHESSENGSQLGSWALGDVIRVGRVGSTIRYYKNGYQIRSVAVNANNEYTVKLLPHNGSAPIFMASFWLHSSRGTVPDAWEFAALVDVYGNLGGSTWTDKTNWPTTDDGVVNITAAQMDSWYGVSTGGGDITSLSLLSNNLTGSIPATISALAALKIIDFRINRIGGELPGTLTSMVALEILRVYDNLISGSIPEDIGNLINLKELVLGKNGFTGSIPESIGSLSELYRLSLYLNSGLTGPLPQSFYNLVNLTDLYIYDTQISGTLKQEIGNFSNLKHFWGYRNQWSGVLPASLGNLDALENLYLYSNNFSGEIPENFRNLLNLQSLWLHYNQLSGNFPEWLSELESLRSLSIGSTGLTGVLPASLGNLTDLTDLYLQELDLTGAIPNELQNLNNLKVLNLSASGLAGPIPDWLVLKPALKEIYLSANKFTSLPNFSSRLDKASIRLNVNNNRIPLADIERNLTGVDTHGFQTFTYQAQESPEAQLQIEEGTLKISGPAGGTNSIFTWERLLGSTWANVNTQNQGPHAFQFVIPVTSTNYSDVFRYTVSNTWISGVTQSREVNVGAFLLSLPISPTMLAYSVDGYQVILTWVNNATNASGIRIERRPHDGLNGPFTVVGEVDPSAEIFTDAHAPNSSSFEYRVYAFNDYGPSPYSNSVYVENLGSASIAAILDNYAFLYKYDGRRRMTHKKVPGADWIYMVYDNRDRLVMTQDGNQRSATPKEWTFTKYDALNRPVLTGIFKDTEPESRDQQAMQEDVNDFYEAVGTSGNTDQWFEETGTEVHGYTNQSFPDVSDGSDYLTVTYYDNYIFRNNIPGGGFIYDVNQLSTADGTFEAQEADEFDRLTGQVTGTKVKNLQTGDWYYTVNYYDDRYRLIQSVMQNHKGGIDKITNVYNFPGWITRTKTSHSVASGPELTTTRKLFYDHAGRLLETWHKTGSENYLLLAANEYNELGQLVTKKLHSENGTSFQQHADYRYNIRGWLARINHSDLSTIDGGPKDFFGMELGYNNDLGIGTVTPQYNGNISAIKWSSNLGLGITDTEFGMFQPTERGYKFKYDTLNRLSSADHADFTGSWNPSTSFFEGNLKYDLNGNIRRLDRTGAGGTQIDELAYSYTGNQLLKVDDHAGISEGFKDGTNTGVDYAYDSNGSMIADKNKGITAIGYNYLNLPDTVIKTTGEYITYAYDATGKKLNQSVFTASEVQQKVTDYVGEFIYENDTLKFINHEEGRVVMTGSQPEYQYHLKDHLGNVRMTFTTKPEQKKDLATFETINAPDEETKFLYYDEAITIDYDLFDHTYDGTIGDTYYSTRLTGGNTNAIYGLAKSLSVMPGDTINMEVFAKYLDPDHNNWTPALTNFLAAISTGTAPQGTVIDGGSPGSVGSVQFPFAGFFDHSSEPEAAPKAYLNFIVFDREYSPIVGESGFIRITTAAKENGTNVDHYKLERDEPLVIRQPGFVYIYLSNENETPVEVFFDDFIVEHIKSPVVQLDDYYPFGLTFNSYQRENSLDQKYLYNGKELQDELQLGWYDYHARLYDPSIGKFSTIDPLADVYDDLSPYHYALNNPINFIDPNGMNSENVQDLIQKAWDSTPGNGSASYDSDGNCTCGCPGKPPCKEEEKGVVEGKGMGDKILKPGQGLRIVDGKREMFETPANHNCDESCALDHFTDADMARAYAEVGLFFAGGTLFRAVLRGGKWVLVAVNASKFGQFAHASKYGIQSYRALTVLTKGKGLHAHHLIEKRFAHLLGKKSGDMASIALTQGEHQAFTNAWRAAIPYGEGTINATRDQVMNAARQIYKNYPEILNALGL